MNNSTISLPKIDLHVHPHLPGGPERLRSGTWPTPDQVRAAYDTLHIEKGIIMSRMAPERMHDPITSRDAEMMYRAYPDTFAGWFCALDPRMATNTPQDNLSYYLDFFKERGAVGAGELQANLYIDDPRMLNLLSHCEKCKMPVTIHFGTLGGDCGVADDPGLPRLEKVLQLFPDLKLLGHAMAFWAEISSEASEEARSGFPKGPVRTEGRIAVLMRKYPNLLCDISAGSGLNALTRDPEYAFRFIDEFYERIYFATDISSPVTIAQTAPSLCHFLDQGYLDGNISERAYRAICRENALALLNGPA